MAARFLSLRKLRECWEDARAFSEATGDSSIAARIREAIQAAERHEPEESWKVCVACGRKHQRERSAYCCYDCAEEDGAVSK